MSNMANKWGIPLKHLMGNDKTSLRAELKKGGARFDSKASEWVMSSEAQYISTLRALGLDSGKPNISNAPAPAPKAAAPVSSAVQTTLPTVGSVKLPGRTAGPSPVMEGVVEVGDVTAGGLLERDALGKVVRKRVLELRPSRFVLINMPVEGIRQRRSLGRREDRTQERGKFAGLESMTVTTTTELTYVLPDEKTAVEELRGKLRYALARMGTVVVPGLIALPLDLEGKFDAELERVKGEASACNTGTQVWKIFVNVIRLDAVTSDEEALARKITYDMQKMLDEVTSALEACDIKRIEAATKELKYKADGMAPGMMRGAVEAAVAQAREMRSFIKRETEKKRRSFDEVKLELDTSIVESARLMLETFAVPEEIEAGVVVESGRLAGLVSDDESGSTSGTVEPSGGSSPTPSPTPSSSTPGNGNGNGNGNGGTSMLPDPSTVDMGRLAGLIPTS